MHKTNTIQIKEINCETGEEIVRDANADELAQIELDAKNAKKERVEAEANATAKIDLLAKLGITAEEARLLLS